MPTLGLLWTSLHAPFLCAHLPSYPIGIRNHRHQDNYMRSSVSSASEGPHLGVTGVPRTQLHYTKFLLFRRMFYHASQMAFHRFPFLESVFLGICLENSYIPIYPFEERYKRKRWNSDVRKHTTSNNPTFNKNTRILRTANIFDQQYWSKQLMFSR